ncbi:MAG: DUF559 domain-containing protein, partial [Calditrichaceae bacterium]|nr:DUF559 domain-containing protein [Calditrichaceae bacterium]
MIWIDYPTPHLSPRRREEGQGERQKYMTVKQLAMQTARYLRKNQTKTEALFWQSVRDKKFLSKKFRRQHP